MLSLALRQCMQLDLEINPSPSEIDNYICIHVYHYIVVLVHVSRILDNIFRVEFSYWWVGLKVVYKRLG